MATFRQLTEKEKKEFEEISATFQKYNSSNEDVNTIRILDERLGVGKYSALNTIERRAIWRAGYERGGHSLIFVSLKSMDSLSWKSISPTGIDSKSSTFWTSDQRKNITENDAYYFELGVNLGWDHRKK